MSSCPSFRIAGFTLAVQAYWIIMLWRRMNRPLGNDRGNARKIVFLFAKTGGIRSSGTAVAEKSGEYT